MLNGSHPLLASLSPALRSYVYEHLEPVRLDRRSIIYSRGDAITDVYFIQSGIAALAWPDRARPADLALIGAEGVIGSELSLGLPTTTFQALSRSEVLAFRVRKPAFAHLCEQSPGFQASMHRFSAELTAQIAETAFVNARLSVEQRVARWIELASRLLKTDTFALTHDDLARAIGCRRAG